VIIFIWRISTDLRSNKRGSFFVLQKRRNEQNLKMFYLSKEGLKRKTGGKTATFHFTKE